MTHFISKEVFQKFERELSSLKEKRKLVAENLRRSAAFGDLAENSEYQQAREEKEFLERKIFELEQKLKNTKGENTTSNSKKISLYSKIKVKNENKIFDIIIVPPEEIDLSKGKISVKSPLGRGFLVKKQDDIVEVKTPLGEETYKIIKFE